MPRLTIKTDHSGKPIIQVYVGIGAAKAEVLIERGLSIPNAKRLSALVDTGASRTLIEESVL